MLTGPSFNASLSIENLDLNTTQNQNASMISSGSSGSLGSESQGVGFLPPPPPGGPGYSVTPLFNQPAAFDVVFSVWINLTDMLEGFKSLVPSLFKNETTSEKYLRGFSSWGDFSLYVDPKNVDPKNSDGKFDFGQIVPPGNYTVCPLFGGREPPGKKKSQLGEKFFNFGFLVTGGAQGAERYLDPTQPAAPAASAAAAAAPAPAAGAAAPVERPSSEYGFTNAAGVRTSVVLDDDGQLVVVERPASGVYGFGADEEALGEGPGATGKRVSKLEALVEEAEQDPTVVESRIQTVDEVLGRLGEHEGGIAILERLGEWIAQQVETQKRLSQMLDPNQSSAEAAGFSPSELARLYQMAEGFGLTHDLIQKMRCLFLHLAELDQLKGVEALLEFPKTLEANGMELSPEMKSRLQEVFESLVARLLLGDLMSYFTRAHAEKKSVATTSVFKYLFERVTRFRGALKKIAVAEKERTLASLIEDKTKSFEEVRANDLAKLRAAENAHAEEEIGIIRGILQTNQRLLEAKIEVIRQELNEEYAYLTPPPSK